jgi:hypothetical protein
MIAPKPEARASEVRRDHSFSRDARVMGAALPGTSIRGDVERARCFTGNHSEILELA